MNTIFDVQTSDVSEPSFFVLVLGREGSLWDYTEMVVSLEDLEPAN